MSSGRVGHASVASEPTFACQPGPAVQARPATPRPRPPRHSGPEVVVDGARGLRRLYMANGPTRHTVPHGPCLIGPRAWPSAQAWPYGPISMLGQPTKHGQNHRPCQPVACYPLYSQFHKHITVHSFIIHTFTVHINTISQFLTFTKSKSKTCLI